tara:strand:+ start:445 stop:765 length:321 start_codon:yes stop_codon:yes gene_type:complete
MKKTQLSFILIILLFMFSSCELETIDGCNYCEINYEIMNTSSLTLNDLNELAVESLQPDYDHYFAVTHESPGQYCDSSLTNIQNEQNYEDLDQDGTIDIQTFWVCQ